MKSDAEIINELKDFWGCESFIFTAEFVEKTKDPDKYSGKIEKIKDGNGKTVKNFESSAPLFFNVKKNVKIEQGPCRIECYLADREFRESKDLAYLLNFKLLPTQTQSLGESEDLKRIRKNWKLEDEFFIGEICYGLKDGKQDQSKYVVKDVRRSDFSKINTKVNIGGLNQNLDIEQYNRYYKFSWVMLSESTSENPRFYIDTKKPVTYFDPKAIVDCIQDDIMHYPGSASQIIVKTLDTLKNQLTASGKEVFIYELLQNANDYPCKHSGKVVPVNVEFRLTKNYLIFQHTGAYFSPRNIAAICNINDKEKTDNKEAIGYKGIGFKTVFLDNNYVFLRTGDYSFRFDWKDSKDILDIPWQILPIWTSLKSTEPEIQETFKNVDSKEFKVQFALRPAKHEILYESERNYVKLFREVFDTERVLLFIPNIGKVTFTCEGYVPIVRCKDNNKWCISDLLPTNINEKIRLSVNKEIEDGDTKIPEKYKDFYKTTVKFACQIEGNELKPVENTTLYCYLPVKKARLGLPFLMNTDMIPTGPRDDIEDLDVNYEISRIAGEKLCEWLSSLLEEGKYQYDSVFSLVPTFAPVTNYEIFIEKIKNGFEDSLAEMDLVPVIDEEETRLINVSKVIYDETGISESGLFTDSELLSFANDSKWTTNSDEFFPHPELRGKPHFKEFIEKYHADDMIFGDEQILEMCSNDDFKEWIADQDNNNRFLDFLLTHDYLSKFIEEKKEIFIGNDGELYDAADLYYNIDEHLSDLSCFSEDYLPRLSVETREYFKENDDWEDQIEDAFNEFDIDDFVSDVLNDKNMKSLLEDIDSSVSFVHFLAINDVENEKLTDLPFINCNGELVDCFDELVFFESERGFEVKEYGWIEDEWINFISNDYFKKDEEKCVEYLKSHFGVLDYSDEEIVNSIIKDSDKRKSINSYLDEIESATLFIDFVNTNADEFDEDSLTDFYLIVVDKDGDTISGTADGNTYLSSELFEELSQKDWITCGWMYSLSQDYFYGKSKEEIESLKLLFIRFFGVKEIQKDSFVDDILLRNINELCDNLVDIDMNIDFWRWIKDNCKEKALSLKDLPIIATNSDDEEGDYVLSSNSIYMSDSLLPDGQYIESIVKKYYDDSLFVISRYAENNQVSKKSWRKFFEGLGILSEQTELVFDQIIPNLSDIEDPGVPSMLAQAKEFFEERNVSISDLTSLRLEKRDGEYADICDCLFVSLKKIEEPFKDIKLCNECVISHYNADTRGLILEIAEEAGATIIENLADWRSEKIAQYLELQDDNDITKELHFSVVKEILEIDERDKNDLLADIHKIWLIAKDDNYYEQEELTLGKEYHPLCNFEANGISDEDLTYLSADYSTLDCENLGKKIRETFKIHYRFSEQDIDLLSNYTFAEFFWREYVSQRNAPVEAIKSMIDNGKFDDVVCVPTPNGKVACAEDLYSRKELKDYMILVVDWTTCFPVDDYPEKSYEILDLLHFRESLSFEDGLNALTNTEDQSKRYYILKWMSDEYRSSDNAQNDMISEYREGEKSKWRNRNKKKCFLRDLYALDIDEDANSKYLEQYFKSHPRVIQNEYFSKSDMDTFYQECEMMQIPIILWDDMILNPTLSESNDDNLPSKLRNYLLFVAAIENPEKWSEYYDSLCDKFDKLSFRRCRSISLTYSKDKDISQTAKKFCHDTDRHIFYYVGEWYDGLVLIDFIDELRDVVGSDLDKDMFRQIFGPKSSIIELESFANEYCIDLADDENFRNIILKQLGVRLELSEYEEDEEEPELPCITKSPEGEITDVDVSEYEDNDDESYESDKEDVTNEDTDEEEEEVELPNVGVPTGIIQKSAVLSESGDSYIEEESENEDDDEDDEPTLGKNTGNQKPSDTINKPSDSETIPNERRSRGAYQGNWAQAQQDSPAVRQRRNYSAYSPDRFQARQFNPGSQEPLTLSRRNISKDEVQYLSNLFGRAFNVDTIKDENYIVRMRFFNSLKENGLEMDMDEREYIENGSKEVVTKLGKYIHRCSARSGILFLSPSVWNRLREGSWVICFYSGKMADQFVYVKTQEELMQIINQDALVIQVTGNDKREMVDKIYEEGFYSMQGNIYTLIRTIKVEGEVTPFDENITDYYSDDDDQDKDAL